MEKIMKLLAFILMLSPTLAFAQAPPPSPAELNQYIRILQSDRATAQQQIDNDRMAIMALQQQAQDAQTREAALAAYWKSYSAGTPK